jgi:hypothetical protein
MSETLRGLDDYLERDPRDGEPDGPALSFVCAEPGCGWQGKGALDHHRATGHPIRIRNQPASWPDQQFSCCTSGACAARAKRSAYA